MIDNVDFLRKLYIDRTPEPTKPEDSNDPYTDGEYIAIHLQAERGSYREGFEEYVQDIAERFSSGEWQGSHKEEVAYILREIADKDKDKMLTALALDAFLANADAGEIAKFNELYQYKHSAGLKEVDLTKRGFSDGKHNSFGIFTDDRERA